MTEEEIKALQEALVAEKAARKLAEDAADKNKTDLDKVVDELKTERQKKQEALDKANLSNDEPDIATLIEKALQDKENERKQADFKSAVDEFRASKPEFQADAAGIVFSKFEQNLGRFNFSDVTNKEQLKLRLEEAYRFMNFTPDAGTQTNYDGTPTAPTIPGEQRPQQQADVKAALEMSGMKEDRLKELRAKYPEAFESIGI
jgi:hypothetical protein